MHSKCCIFATSNHPDTAKMAAATPISPHHDRSRGGERSEGEDLTTPPGARRRKRPTASGLWQAPHKPVYGPRPPGARPFPGTGSLKKAAGDAQANASRPKDAPEHHPHAPFGKGRQKSRQKEYIDIVGYKNFARRGISVRYNAETLHMLPVKHYRFSGFPS